MTLDQWLAHDGPGELVGGHLVEEKAATRPRIAVADWFAARLRDWASPRGGAVFGPGHKLAISATMGRKPEVVVYMPPHTPGETSTNTAPTPTLIVEVSSADPVERRRVYMTAMRDYAGLGVHWYWTIDPSERLFESWQLDAEGHYTLFLVATEGAMSSTGPEGLTLDLDALWAALASLEP